MKRIFEELAFANVFAPQSVDKTTDKTTAFVDTSGAGEIAFLVSTAALGAGKKVTVTVMGSNQSTGASAKAIGDAVEFSDSVGTDPKTIVVSYQVDPANPRYIGLKFQHDGDAAVLCGVAVVGRSLYLPAANGWTVAK